MNGNKRYKALIEGKSYTIIGNETKSQLDRVTVLLNEQLKELKTKAKALTTEEAAILMAINAINEQFHKEKAYLMIKKENDTLKQQIEALKVVEEKVKKYEELEKKAKQVVKKQQGIEKDRIDPIEAQKVLNEVQKQRIKEKSEA